MVTLSFFAVFALFLAYMLFIAPRLEKRSLTKTDEQALKDPSVTPHPAEIVLFSKIRTFLIVLSIAISMVWTMNFGTFGLLSTFVFQGVSLLLLAIIFIGFRNQKKVTGIFLGFWQTYALHALLCIYFSHFAIAVAMFILSAYRDTSVVTHLQVVLFTWTVSLILIFSTGFRRSVPAFAAEMLIFFDRRVMFRVKGNNDEKETLVGVFLGEGRQIVPLFFNIFRDQFLGTGFKIDGNTQLEPHMVPLRNVIVDVWENVKEKNPKIHIQAKDAFVDIYLTISFFIENPAEVAIYGDVIQDIADRARKALPLVLGYFYSEEVSRMLGVISHLIWGKRVVVALTRHSLHGKGAGSVALNEAGAPLFVVEDSEDESIDSMKSRLLERVKLELDRTKQYNYFDRSADPANAKAGFSEVPENWVLTDADVKTSVLQLEGESQSAILSKVGCVPVAISPSNVSLSSRMEEALSELASQPIQIEAERKTTDSVVRNAEKTISALGEELGAVVAAASDERIEVKIDHMSSSRNKGKGGVSSAIEDVADSLRVKKQ